MTTFFHGSIGPLDIGAELQAPADGYVTKADPELEALFEAERPETCVSRASAVFLVRDADDIDAAGGYSDEIYEVQPVGQVSLHDLSWYSEAQCALSDGDPKRARDCARAYWIGEAFERPDESLFEVLASRAVVIRGLKNEMAP